MEDDKFLILVQLAESEDKVRWVHALSYGTFKHPVFGEKVIDTDRVKRYHDNIQKGVRGIDLYINYDHREHTGDAAGWIKDSDIRDDGLWLKVDFTDKAVEKIKGEEYKYFSAEFTDKYTDPKSEREYEDVMIGGALTNVPFLKDLKPLTLSEIKQENSMEREELLKLLGLEPDASDDDIKTKVGTLTEKDDDEPTLDDLEIQIGDPDDDGKATITVKRGDTTKDFTVDAPVPVNKGKEEKDDDELAKLAESHPEVKQLVERVGHLESAQKLSETDATLSEVGKKSKKALSPVVKKKLRGFMVQLSETATKDLTEVLESIAAGEGVVDLSEKGKKTTDPNEGGGSDDPVTKFMETVDSVREEDKDGNLTYADAIAAAGKKEPELYAEYRRATTRNANLS